jgi:alanine racemase
MTACTAAAVGSQELDERVPARANVFEIDLDAFDHNVGVIRRIVGPDVALFAALKANAYGFGTLEMARAAVAAGADGLAVVDLRDAVAIRETGLTVPLHLYGGMLITPEVTRYVSANDIMPTVLSLDDARTLSAHATRPVRVFIKIEVGLERFGIAVDDVGAFAGSIQAMPNIAVYGLCTHLHVPRRAAAVAQPYLDRQFTHFQQAIREVEAICGPVAIKMAASSGSLSLAWTMNLNAVDPGHLLFGLRPGGPETQPLDIEPVIRSLRSTMVHIHHVRRSEFIDLAPFPVRPGMRVGVLPIGVVDGMLSLHAGAVLVHGVRCPVLGVSLEHTRIDVSEVAAKVGDDAVIIGAQGGDAITIGDVLAHHKLGIPASVPLAVQPTVPRRYLRRDS